MKLIQTLPVRAAGGGSDLPYAVIGIEENGGMWFGVLKYDGKQKDGGPLAVAWRPIDHE